MSSPASDTFVSIVVALRNAESFVEKFAREAEALLRENYANYELVVVDDGSSDRTYAVLKGLLTEIPCVRVLGLSRPFGREAALLAGLESTIGDYVVVLDPLTDPVTIIPAAVARCRGGAGVMVGRPQNLDPHGVVRRISSNFFHAYSKRILKVEMPVGARSFFVLSRAALNAVLQVKDRVRHLRYLAGVVGFRFESIDYDYTAQPREKDSWSELISEGLSIVLANSKHPLRFVSLLGLAASGVNLLYMGYIVMVYLLKPNVAAGWTTLSMQASVMFFLVFLILTVLSEYVALVLQESQTRPSYFVSGEINSNVAVKDPERRNVVQGGD